MAYEPKPNSGSMFNNDRKEKDSHPDRTGQGSVDCPHCGSTINLWLNGWVKRTKDGLQFLSISFRPKEDRKGQGRGNARSGYANSGAPPEYQPGPTNRAREGNSYAAAKQGEGGWKRDPKDEIPF